MHFRILGPLEIHDDQRGPVPLDSPRLRAVVCRLLIDPGRVVPAESLVTSLWGDDAPPGAAGTVQTYVTRLRRVLEPGRQARGTATVLLTRPSGYAIALDDSDVDAAEMERLVRSGSEALARGDATTAASMLASARAMWRGRPFHDVADAPWALPSVARLEQLHVTAIELQVDACLALGDHGTAIGELERHVHDHPLHERYWAQLITALYRSGRQSDALRAYSRCRETLRDELGVEPGPELRALERAVLAHDPVLDLRRPPSAPNEERSPPASSVTNLSAVTPAPPSRPFVGRATEREQVIEALAGAREGRGKIVVIEGEAGIGKTRLAEATAQHAAASGLAVTWTVCLDEIGAPPLWPWLQIRDQITRRTPTDADRPPRNAAGADDASALFRELAAVADDLVAASNEQPMVAIIDDLQWADQASLQLLRLLIGRLADAPIVVVATVRRPDANTSRALDATLADLVRSPHHLRIRLTGLAPQESADLVAAIAGGPQDGITAALHRRTRGNPFFLCETAKLLASEAGDSAVLSTASIADLVPDTVREVVERRVLRLPDDTQSILRLAAIAGSGIELAVLQHATGLDADEATTLLEPAVQAGLLVDMDDAIGWRFGHALAQDAVRATIARTTRARLHATLAGSIEHVHLNDLDAHLDELAHHSYEGAPVAGKAAALAWLLAAARSAHRRHGYDRAAFHWGRALDLSDPSDSTDRFELLLLLAENLRLMGDPEQARVRLEEAIALARRLGDDERAARAAVVFGGVTLWYWRPYGMTAWAMVDEVERLAATASGARRVELLGTLGVELYYSHRRPDGMRAAQQSVELARQAGDVALLGRALNNFVLAVWEPGPDGERPEAIDEALGLVGRGLPLQTELIARLHRAANRLRHGDLDAFRHDLDRCRGMAAELAVPELRAQVIYASGGLAMLRGGWAEAERLAHEAFEIQSRTSLWGAEWAKIMQLVPVLVAQGRIAEFADDAERIASLPGMDAAWPLAALAVAEAGDPARAHQLAEQWWKPDRQPDWTTDHQLADWGWLATRIGFPDPAEMYDKLLPYADRLVVAGTAVACRGSTQLLLGQLAVCRGKPADAAQHFDDAARRNDAIGAAWYATAARQERALIAAAG
ncbi:MAG: BTAD domain-containing putative transcriptional regulator [Ilumatobacteraceae bacterium]